MQLIFIFKPSIKCWAFLIIFSISLPKSSTSKALVTTSDATENVGGKIQLKVSDGTGKNVTKDVVGSKTVNNPVNKVQDKGFYDPKSQKDNLAKATGVDKGTSTNNAINKINTQEINNLKPEYQQRIKDAETISTAKLNEATNPRTLHE